MADKPKDEPKANKATKETKETKETGKQSAKSASKSVKSVIKEIEKLSVLELAELVKALEEKFGVSAAPVAAPAAASTPAGGEAEAGDQPTKSKFNVVLAEAGANKIAVIKAVREVNQSLGLKEAKDLVEAVPKEVLTDAGKDDAEAAKKKLEDAGGKVELK